MINFKTSEWSGTIYEITRSKSKLNARNENGRLKCMQKYRTGWPKLESPRPRNLLPTLQNS